MALLGTSGAYERRLNKVAIRQGDDNPSTDNKNMVIAGTVMFMTVLSLFVLLQGLNAEDTGFTAVSNTIKF